MGIFTKSLNVEVLYKNIKVFNNPGKSPIKTFNEIECNIPMRVGRCVNKNNLISSLKETTHSEITCKLKKMFGNLMYWTYEDISIIL